MSSERGKYTPDYYKDKDGHTKPHIDKIKYDNVVLTHIILKDKKLKMKI